MKENKLFYNFFLNIVFKQKKGKEGPQDRFSPWARGSIKTALHAVMEVVFLLFLDLPSRFELYSSSQVVFAEEVSNSNCILSYVIYFDTVHFVTDCNSVKPFFCRPLFKKSD